MRPMGWRQADREGCRLRPCREARLEAAECAVELQMVRAVSRVRFRPGCKVGGIARIVPIVQPALEQPFAAFVPAEVEPHQRRCTAQDHLGQFPVIAHALDHPAAAGRYGGSERLALALAQQFAVTPPVNIVEVVGRQAEGRADAPGEGALARSTGADHPPARLATPVRFLRHVAPQRDRIAHAIGAPPPTHRRTSDTLPTSEQGRFSPLSQPREIAVGRLGRIDENPELERNLTVEALAQICANAPASHGVDVR